MRWPTICPVCREELPERGNRRLHVPGRGLRLVHAGSCAEQVEAQGVLDLTSPPPLRPDPVLVARMRRFAELGHRRAVQSLDQDPQRFLALARRLADLPQPLARSERQQRLHDLLLDQRELLNHMRQLAGLRHDREVCAPPRTELLA